MKYWRIRFDSFEGMGWLVLDDQLTALRLTDDDGNDITQPCDYTTIDTEAEPPEWA